MPRGLISLLCQRIESGGISALTNAERQIYAVNWLLIETNLGGFHQIFFNEAGKYAADALDGLQAIGALETAAVFKNAIALFPSGSVPIELTARRSALAELSAEVQWEYLGELTAQFFRAGDDIPKLVDKYISTHRELFPVIPSN